MNALPPADSAPLRILVLGAGAAALAEAVTQGLREHLQQSPSRPLRWLEDLQSPEAMDAELCWLQAWDDREGMDPVQSLAELQAHNGLRQGLHVRGRSYLVLRGSLPRQQAQALQSLLPWLPELRGRLAQTGEASRRPGAWSCDKCGDPDCEHQSLKALRQQRGQD